MYILIFSAQLLRESYRPLTVAVLGSEQSTFFCSEAAQKLLTLLRNCEVGFALMQIRDNRYYRETHGTFEEYCKVRWGFGRNYANILIRASDTYNNLGTMVPKDISGRAIRPLASLPPDQQREVYQKAVEAAPKGVVTARHMLNKKKEEK